MKNIIFFALLFATKLFYGQLAVSFYSVQHVSCYGGSNGVVGTSISGGTAAYTCTWQPGNTNSFYLSNVSAGIYTVTVMDATTSTVTKTIEIYQPNQLQVNATSISSVSCYDMCDGYAQISANGGSAPYSFLWSPTGTNSPQQTNLCAGNYTYQVIDSHNCQATMTLTIIQPPPLNLFVSATNVSHCGACDGSASASVFGGSGNYSYNWFQQMNPNNQTINNLCVGSGSVMVIDVVNNCQAFAGYSISNPTFNPIPNTSFTTTVTNETCYGMHDGNILLNNTGSNVGPFTYMWSNGASTSSIYNLGTNYYQVTVTDGTNCAIMGNQVGIVGGSSCGSISGNVFFDTNTNCLLNSGEQGYQGATIWAHGGFVGNYYGYSDAQGNYTINNLSANSLYTLTILPNNSNITTPCYNIQMAVLSSTNTNVVQNFPVSILLASSPDVYVSAYSSPIVPGFNSCANYQVSNLTNYATQGIYKVVLPTTLLANIVSVSPSTYTISADTIMWDFSLLPMFNAYTNFNVCFTTPINTPLWSSFTTCAIAQTSVPDLNPANNSYCYQRLVTGSFDPNDKSVSPTGVGANGDILNSEMDLTYLIRFQNTGNGPAVNIIVEDTLSPNVDVSTFKMLSVSHNYHVDILPGNILKWKFNNIMLADSGSNEAGSHGYIQYTIKRKASLQPGNQIKNTAYIYFDFNAPVITNTTKNTIALTVGVKELTKASTWSVYPNPTTNLLSVIGDAQQLQNSKLEILNTIGQSVLKTNYTGNLDVSELTNGIYFLKITTSKNEQSVLKFIKK